MAFSLRPNYRSGRLHQPLHIRYNRILSNIPLRYQILLFILGITCAMAWQLPHEPFDENFLKDQFLMDDMDDPPKRRIDENITDIDYADRNYNSLDTSSWNDVLENNKVSSSASWDDSTRFVSVFINQNYSL